MVAKNKNKKTNPRKKPANQSDVKRAKDAAVIDACDFCWAIMLSVLRDKEGYDTDGLKRVYNEINDLADSITQKYVSVADLKNTLKQEEGIYLK